MILEACRSHISDSSCCPEPSGNIDVIISVISSVVSVRLDGNKNSLIAGSSGWYSGNCEI